MKSKLFISKWWYLRRYGHKTMFSKWSHKLQTKKKNILWLEMQIFFKIFAKTIFRVNSKISSFSLIYEYFVTYGQIIFEMLIFSEIWTKNDIFKKITKNVLLIEMLIISELCPRYASLIVITITSFYGQRNHFFKMISK